MYKYDCDFKAKKIKPNQILLSSNDPIHCTIHIGTEGTGQKCVSFAFNVCHTSDFIAISNEAVLMVFCQNGIILLENDYLCIAGVNFSLSLAQ